MPYGPPGAPVADVKPHTRYTQAQRHLWTAVLRDAPRALKNARKYGVAMRRPR